MAAQPPTPTRLHRSPPYNKAPIGRLERKAEAQTPKLDEHPRNSTPQPKLAPPRAGKLSSDDF